VNILKAVVYGDPVLPGENGAYWLESIADAGADAWV